MELSEGQCVSLRVGWAFGWKAEGSTKRTLTSGWRRLPADPRGASITGTDNLAQGER
jgi:hypothetical protein